MQESAGGGSGAIRSPSQAKANPNDGEQRFHLLLFGQVQGVGFRLFAQREAARHSVHGWVRNREDGAVEVWAEGAREPLTAFLNQLLIGPIGADVRDYQVEWGSPTGRYSSFHIRE